MTHIADRRACAAAINQARLQKENQEMDRRQFVQTSLSSLAAAGLLREIPA